jgi:hypothetical protein
MMQTDSTVSRTQTEQQIDPVSDSPSTVVVIEPASHAYKAS